MALVALSDSYATANSKFFKAFQLKSATKFAGNQ